MLSAIGLFDLDASKLALKPVASSPHFNADTDVGPGNGSWRLRHLLSLRDHENQHRGIKLFALACVAAVGRRSGLHAMNVLRFGPCKRAANVQIHQPHNLQKVPTSALIRSTKASAASRHDNRASSALQLLVSGNCWFVGSIFSNDDHLT